jgi:hypothetical protein
VPPGNPFARNPGWGRVGIRIHPVRSGQDALEVGRPIGKRLASLVGNAVEGINVSQSDLIGRGDSVLLRSPDNHQRIVGSAVQPRANLAQFLQGILIVGPLLAVQQNRALVGAGDHADAPSQLGGEDLLRL